jgi:hypothetical protein
MLENMMLLNIKEISKEAVYMLYNYKAYEQYLKKAKKKRK